MGQFTFRGDCTRSLGDDGDVAAAFDDGVFDLFEVFDAALLARCFENVVAVDAFALNSMETRMRQCACDGTLDAARVSMTRLLARGLLEVRGRWRNVIISAAL